MKTLSKLFAASAGLVLLTNVCMAENTAEHKMSDMPKPTQEHTWLQQMVGEWDSETDATMEPGQAPIHTKGTEKVKAIGGFWTVSEINGDMMGQPFHGNMTLGYDVEKKKYVGTWVDSMTGKLWNYEGTVDPAGKTLTLISEGTCPMQPGKLMHFKESIELKDKDHKVFTSQIQDDATGKWITMMTSTAQRRH